MPDSPSPLRTLLTTLVTHSISPVVLANCQELVDREQVGLQKYGVSLSDAKLTDTQLLQHLLEEQLDSANYTRALLQQLRDNPRVLVQAAEEKAATPVVPRDTPQETTLLMRALKDLLFRMERHTQTLPCNVSREAWLRATQEVWDTVHRYELDATLRALQEPRL